MNLTITINEEDYTVVGNGKRMPYTKRNKITHYLNGDGNLFEVREDININSPYLMFLIKEPALDKREYVFGGVVYRGVAYRQVQPGEYFLSSMDDHIQYWPLTNSEPTRANYLILSPVRFCEHYEHEVPPSLLEEEAVQSEKLTREDGRKNNVN